MDPLKCREKEKAAAGMKTSVAALIRAQPPKHGSFTEYIFGDS
jgi:hypothetical protein